jgi:hypothetical protein
MVAENMGYAEMHVADRGQEAQAEETISGAASMNQLVGRQIAKHACGEAIGRGQRGQLDPRRAMARKARHDGQRKDGLGRCVEAGQSSVQPRRVRGARSRRRAKRDIKRQQRAGRDQKRKRVKQTAQTQSQGRQRETDQWKSELQSRHAGKVSASPGA